MCLRSLFLFCILFSLTSQIASSESHVVSRQTTSVNVDQYCINTFGKGSYMCRNSYNTGYDYICGSLYCFDPVHQHLCVFSIPPQDSTLCGNGRWCVSGVCVADAHAQVTSDKCPLGDSLKPNVMLGMNCSEVIQKMPSLCRDPEMQKWCCGGCAQVQINVPATFIGPAVSADGECKAIFGAKSYFCQTDPIYGGGDFSATCKNMMCWNPNAGVCVSFPASDGVPCGGGMWCVNGQCVASSLASVDPQSDCLYGDQFSQFCQINIVEPQIAIYCGRYESSCCASCLAHKNTSAPANCQYGDLHPDVCQQHKQDHSIAGFCVTHETDCCETCANIKKNTDPNCPFGDVSESTCKALMNDSIGPGNCYNQNRRRECCDTCQQYYNASNTGCEYGDHWKDYCATNVVPPKVATECSKYESQCCGTCGKHRIEGMPGCEYGDTDPIACEALMHDDKGTSNCYDAVTQTQCCATCGRIRDTSTPGCMYGDTKPAKCVAYFNDSQGIGNCYDVIPQFECCRSCANVQNVTNVGCEFGDHLQEWCNTNIYDSDTAFICYTQASQCCETCAQYKISDIPDCKYGDKNPTQCRFMIPNAEQAVIMCASSVGTNCCATCSKYGQQSPAGFIPMITG